MESILAWLKSNHDLLLVIVGAGVAILDALIAKSPSKANSLLGLIRDGLKKALDLAKRLLSAK